MKIKQSEAASLISEWAEFEKQKHVPIENDEVSQKSFAELCGFSPDKAARVLERYVKAGTWTKREAMINGKKGFAYRPVKAPKGK